VVKESNRVSLVRAGLKPKEGRIVDRLTWKDERSISRVLGGNSRGGCKKRENIKNRNSGKKERSEQLRMDEWNPQEKKNEIGGRVHCGGRRIISLNEKGL